MVTGQNAAKLQWIIKAENVREAYNNRYREGMFTSVQARVAALDADTETFFLMLVDYPLITPKVLLDLFAMHSNNRDSFLVPCF